MESEVHDRLVATLAHDLRNDLATLSNLVFYLDARLKAQPNPDLQRAVTQAMGQVRHMAQLIDDLSNSGDRSVAG
jgi:signal transduction histidine kinase